MGKIIQHSNYRVEVYPRRIGDGGFIILSDHLMEPDELKRLAFYKEACEKMVPDLKRHVDGVLTAQVACDSTAVCSFCGYAWGGKTDVYNGGCCERDEAISLGEIEAAEAVS